MKQIYYILIVCLMTSFELVAQVDRTKQPQPEAWPTVNVGKPKEFTLSNGLTVLVVENHKLPRVFFSLSFDNPLRIEGNLVGIRSLVSSMMGNGTNKMSKEEYNELSDYYGANVWLGAWGVKGNSLSKYFAKVLKHAANGVLDPLFTEGDLKSEKARLLDGLKAQEKDVKVIAQRVRNYLLYGQNYPEGEFETEESINKITLDDIKTFYRENFVPEKAYLTVVGDIQYDDVKKMIIENFSSWKKQSPPKSNYINPVNINATQIDFIDMPNAVQSEIIFSNIVNLKMSDPDYFAALLANQVLGGGADGYLFLNLRETHGWTYGSFSTISGNKYLTDFTASASVRNSVTDSAVTEIWNELKRIRTTLITEEDLNQVKAKYIGNFVMNAENPSNTASFALITKTQSLPDDFYDNYLKSINKVTPEDVRAAAIKYFLTDKARIVIVGKATDVLPGLEKLGLPINYYDKYGNPIEKPKQEVVNKNVTVNSILNRYIEVIGGADRLNGVKTLLCETTGTVQGKELTTIKKMTADGKAIESIAIDGMIILKMVFNGVSGYTEMQGQRIDLTEADIREVKYRGIFPELEMLQSNSLLVEGIEKINDKDAYKLSDGNQAYFYDTVSGLKIGESIKKEITPEHIIEQIGSYDDYREIDGIKFPYKISASMGEVVKMEVKNYKINTEISDADFQ